MKIRLGKKIIRLKKRQLVLGGFLVVAGLVIVGGFLFMERESSLPLTPKTSALQANWIPKTVKRWSRQIIHFGELYKVDPDLIAIIMTLESGGHTKANSGVAKGLMQVTDYTARDIAAKHLRSPQSKYDLYDPATSIEFGAAYLSHLRDILCVPRDGLSDNECVELVAAGYNGGPGAAGRLFRGEGLTDMETVSYSRDAYNMWRERQSQTSPTFERWRDRGGQILIDAAEAEMDA